MDPLVCGDFCRAVLLPGGAAARQRCASASLALAAGSSVTVTLPVGRAVPRELSVVIATCDSPLRSPRNLLSRLPAKKTAVKNVAVLEGE
jgi:hypothetical protein